ncbi:FecR family protein [Chryseobacterium populi]|uniref:Fe2+-dicitrate sensor, membrane component n=1 Tax=Chryseobacterium populi TaxID=1144316 RepID=J2K2N1_9FLAO|nr:FecR family protein [Chryseobacterium populi]EJL74415.1 Fe2+-dicitrate sensor, membrane component [Chryseobacterium populi]
MKEKETKDQEKNNELTPEEFKEMWNKVSSQIQVKERKKKVKLISALAVVVLLGLLSIVGYNRVIRPDVYMAERTPIDLELKDGTKVRLLEGGKLSVEKSFPAEVREVRLDGNAIFNVTKSMNHPFIVHANRYQTKVLGTVFKITQANKDFKVDLYEGEVAIAKNGDTDGVYLLHPQETFNNYGNVKVVAISSMVKDPANKVEQRKEKSGGSIRLQFNGCRLKDALLVVENTYDVQINFPGSYGEKMISIDLTGMPVEAVLQNMALSLGLQLKFNANDQIYQLEK